MSSIVITVDGTEYTCSATLIPNRRGPVVSIELAVGGMLRGRAGIFPPYHAGEEDRLGALPPEGLAEAVLNLFIAGNLGVTVGDILQRYDALVSAGFDGDILAVKARTTFYVHP